MEISPFIFLVSGLFLGWSLGANDAANIFGTAVGTRMVKFRTAALVASIFVIIGAVVSGAGTSVTLGKLGSINTLGGAFVVAFSAGLTVFLMNRTGIPVSTSQAIVGGIIGWNVYSGSVTDYSSLQQIFSAWVASPLLAAAASILLLSGLRFFLNHITIHLFWLDWLNRIALVLVGAFGAYSLGANNIGNVMGVFVPVSPFQEVVMQGVSVSGVQQLFLFGGLAIAVGIFTYSQRVMMTVGRGIIDMTPDAALVVVLAHSLVLFAFASRGLQGMLASFGLPALPLVPVSSSQVVVGAVIGVGIVRGGGRNIRYALLRRIATGWVITPVAASLVCFIFLFVMQNVFGQHVYRCRVFELSKEIVEYYAVKGYVLPADIIGREFHSERRFLAEIDGGKTLPVGLGREIAVRSEVVPVRVSLARRSSAYWRGLLNYMQYRALSSLDGNSYASRFEFANALKKLHPKWEDSTLRFLLNEFYDAGPCNWD
ncbi:MAG: inorganic phosphate transporter [bacterium]|nr:inorganic phosphate transporter [bacterium]